MRKLINLFKNESGATAIEYALIASMISIVIIGAATYLGSTLSNSFEYTGEELNKANTGSGGGGPTPN